MPVIDLPTEPPVEGVNYNFPMMATMLFPRARDSRLRDQWLAASAAGAYWNLQQEGAPEESLRGYHHYIKTLWEIKKSPKRVYEDGITRARRASLSGRVLIYLLRLATYRPEHRNLKCAQALAQRFTSTKGLFISDSLIQKVWAGFQNVSHLWAVYAHTAKEDSGRTGPGNAAWIQFMAKAETLRRMAEAQNLLNPRKTWTVPECVELPPAEFEIHPLNEKERQLIEDEL